MTDTLKPRDAKEVEFAVQWALAEGKALEVIGQGSKRDDRPAGADRPHARSVRAQRRHALRARGTGAVGAGRYAARRDRGAGRGQRPATRIRADGLRPAARRAAGRGTIGGVLATNLAGPRRIQAGAARDHFLGFTAVSGRGETFKSGGRVVKNVTGYDLCKLLAGSWGTLAAMTDVTIKTLPRPESEETILVLGLEPARAVAAMTAAMGSSCDVSGAAHLPAGAAALVPDVAGAGTAVTALRLEGFAPSVAHRAGTCRAMLKPFGEVADIGPEASRAVLARGARCRAPGGRAGRGRPHDLAHLDGAEPWRRTGGRGRGGLPMRVFCSIGPAASSGWRCRRSDDAGAALVRRRGRRDRRPCDAHPRASRGARGGRGVRAARCGACGVDPAGQGRLRSQGRAESRPHVGGRVMNGVSLCFPGAAPRGAPGP